VDIATKLAGRLTEVLAKEGDLVDKNQIVAKIDTSTLQALLKQAEAEVKRAKQARETALSRVEGIRLKMELAVKELDRSNKLFAKGIFTQQQLDRDQTVKQTYDAEYAAAKSSIVEAENAIESAVAQTERLKTEINECLLKSPIKGLVLSRLAEPGEVLPNGGKVLTIIDPTDIYMNVYLSEKYAGVIPLGGEAKVVLDAIPDRQFLARVAYVSEKAQFTPKEVEATEERQKLVFRAKISFQEFNDPRLKPGMPGVAYIRLNPSTKWTELFK
jgi:HlyD family secretion protein